jgi:hypothetical protein
MQLDLALFLRLARPLEGAAASPMLASDAHAAVLRGLDQLLLAVDERLDILRDREAVVAPITKELIVEELEETKEVQPQPEPEPEEEVPEEKEEPKVWTAQHDLLYEDILWLFKIGDNEGALISLGRLLAAADGTQELERFLDINQNKLTSLYQRILGPFQQPLSVQDSGLGDRYFWNPEQAHAVWKLGRESKTLAELLDSSPLSPIRTLALTHRLQTEGVFVLQRATGHQHSAEG